MLHRSALDLQERFRIYEKWETFYSNFFLRNDEDAAFLSFFMWIVSRNHVSGFDLGCKHLLNELIT